MHPRSAFASATLLLSLLVAPAARASWDLAPLATDEGGVRAVAIARDGRIAAGGGRGTWIGTSRSDLRRIDLSGETRDLAFAEDGALWIANETGLYRFAGQRVLLHAPAPGDLARDVRRVATHAMSVAAVTAAGVYAADDGIRFARIDVPVGESGASAVAIGPGAAGDALWIASERGLFRAEPNGAVAARAEREALPVQLRPVLDVSATHDGRVLAIAPGWLAERTADGAWRAVRISLPPGATPVRVAASAAGVWIATDRGILAAASAAARFERASDPAGSAPTNALALADARVLAGTARGLLVGSVESHGAIADAAPIAASVGGCDPDVRAVQRAALDFLRLAGDPAAAMRRGVRVRGFFPIVTLEGRKGRDELERHAWDQSYISSGYRHLYDEDDARNREDEVALRLTWDLGDAAYHPEQIDVSTEARRLIELRDDVLDELNQLYFDRQRALAAAAAFEPGSPDAARERLRADELAAGLDAWTDGWFGRSASCRTASAPR
jgi:hypothetical protein